MFIEILNKTEIVTSHLYNINFKLAYIDEEFTNTHVIIRAFFVGVSVILCLVYLCKMYRLPKTVRRTYDQRALFWITITLVWFNDPLYPFNVNTPTFYTYVAS